MRVSVDGIEQSDKTIPLVDDHKEHWVQVRKSSADLQRYLWKYLTISIRYQDGFDQRATSILRIPGLLGSRLFRPLLKGATR